MGLGALLHKSPAEFRALAPTAQIFFLGLIALIALSFAAIGYLIHKYGIPWVAVLPGLLWTGALAAILSAGRRRTTAVLLFTVAATIALRILALLLLDGRLLGSDPLSYSVLADNLLAGRGLVIEDRLGHQVRAGYPPLYPIVLAGARALGGASAATTLVLNTLIDFAAAFLIVHLGSLLGVDRGARLVAALYLLLPTTVLFAIVPQKEGLAILLVLSLLVGMVRLVQREAEVVRSTLIIGSSAAALALCQPAYATLPVLFYAALFVARRNLRGKLILSAAGALLICCSLMMPWWVRNFLLFGQFVPLTSGSGASLWVGMTGTTSDFPPEFLGGQEPDRYDAIGARAVELIRREPLAYAVECIAKFWRAFTFQDGAVHQLMQLRPSITMSQIQLLMPAVQLSYILLLVAAVRSFWQTRFQSNHKILMMFVWASLAQVLVFQIWFEFRERHRLHTFVVLLLLIAIGLSRSRAPREPMAASSCS